MLALCETVLEQNFWTGKQLKCCIILLAGQKHPENRYLYCVREGLSLAPVW